jgi:hypothetical protein
MNKGLERKLKREKVIVCLNCKKFVKCDEIGSMKNATDFKGARTIHKCENSSVHIVDFLQEVVS